MDAWLIALLAGIILCAIQAIRATRLLSAAIWLAGVSALVAIILYALGAQTVAVIELSVGAGLVTVLFVFAISIAGEDAMTLRSLVPRPFAWVLVLAIGGLLAWMTLPALGVAVLAIDPPMEEDFSTILWEARGLDALVQIALIFAGVIVLVGLLVSPEQSNPVQMETPMEQPKLHTGAGLVGGIGRITDERNEENQA